jgi:cell shape-determining protein MreC
MKYKLLLAFAIGFIIATGIGIVKQKKVAGKANQQISTANTVISDLQNKQREYEDLKRQVNAERQQYQQQIDSYLQEIQDLRDNIGSQQPQQADCPSFPQPKGGEIWIIPSNFQMQLGPNRYNCRTAR